MDSKIYNLSPVYYSQKGYYGKAKIIMLDSEWEILLSYDKKILFYDGKNVFIYPNLCYDKHLSNTTMKHIREFLYQKGYKTLIKNSKDILISALKILEEE